MIKEGFICKHCRLQHKKNLINRSFSFHGPEFYVGTACHKAQFLIHFINLKTGVIPWRARVGRHSATIVLELSERGTGSGGLWSVDHLSSPHSPPLHLHGITKGRSKNGRGGDIKGIISSIVEYWKVLTGVYNNIRIINYLLWCCTMNSIESLAIIRFICGKHPVYRWEWQCRRFSSEIKEDFITRCETRVGQKNLILI